MPVNPYFNNYRNKSEQRLVEDLVSESIKINGCEAFYLPMENIEERDLIYGEDPLKKFTSSFPIEIYITTTMEYGGEREIFSKFGLEIKNTVTAMLSRKTYHERVNDKTMLSRPTEGDLVYIPVLNGFGELYEIKFVNQTHDMATLGRKIPFCYELELEKFKYSHEEIDTGNASIDIIHKKDAYTQEITFTSVIGAFQIGEIVYQSSDTTYANSTAKGTVSTYISPTKTIFVNEIVGEFVAGIVLGQTSGANGTIGVPPDEYEQSQDHADYDNSIINTEVTGYVDNSEQNSFGKL